ncbi:uncharacterized protein A1O9_05124 [Exophiala aquamarina CBS 119918]|uniref:Transcription factor domain-containing protein n=1 Tax=Exophiala aquamarina CBS 119918 TaxID=1182545 RepID=A0A072PJM9_9EURO|nr:uncharacterized protein A1O9_05124 [Exophiala aquamarina CBS 119918]KEF60274.1 hypothetical protein A1O9_05124 [Exophiala aquamarina CBS 119918]
MFDEMNAKNKTVGLLFVNKTVSSKSLSNSKADSQNLREINQHVQKSRDLGKERQNRRLVKRSGTLPLGWTSLAPCSHSHSHSHLTLPLATIDPDLQATDKAQSRSAVEQEALKGPIPDRNAAKSTRTHSHGHDPSSRLLQVLRPSRSSVEPFGQFRVSIDAEKHRILQYFVFKFFPAVTRLDIVSFIGFNQKSPTSPAIQILRNSLSEELHFLALLTAASARMKYVEQYHFARADLPEQLADVTLRLLRRYLAQSKPVTQELLQSILYLWAVESYRRNWDAVLMHGRMIMHLCNTHFGGFQNLNPYLRRMLWVADRFQAAATARPPLVEERWETEELTFEQSASAMRSLREDGREPNGRGFSQASVHFSPKFGTVVAAVVNLAHVIQCHWAGLCGMSRLPDRDWAVARSYTLSDELLSFKDEVGTTAHNHRDSRIQDCVRLALIVWLAFVPASAPYSPADHDTGVLTIRAAIDARPLRNRLASLTAHFESSTPSPEKELLLFWVAGLGTVASELVENQEWFAFQFQRYARKLTVYSWDDFGEINDAYLLLDRLQQSNHTKLSWLLQRAIYAESSEEDTPE